LVPSKISVIAIKALSWKALPLASNKTLRASHLDLLYAITRSLRWRSAIVTNGTRSCGGGGAILAAELPNEKGALLLAIMAAGAAEGLNAALLLDLPLLLRPAATGESVE
jgi:hypothetical protein